MKILIWAAFVLVILFWTGLIALTEQLSQWLLASMPTGQVTDLTQITGQWPVPAWLGLWVDTAWIEGVQEMGVGFLAWLMPLVPSSESLMGWISPLLWITWGIGSFVLLVCTLVVNWLIGKR